MCSSLHRRIACVFVTEGGWCWSTFLLVAVKSKILFQLNQMSSEYFVFCSFVYEETEQTDSNRTSVDFLIIIYYHNFILSVSDTAKCYHTVQHLYPIHKHVKIYFNILYGQFHITLTCSYIQKCTSIFIHIFV